MATNLCKDIVNTLSGLTDAEFQAKMQLFMEIHMFIKAEQLVQLIKNIDGIKPTDSYSPLSINDGNVTTLNIDEGTLDPSASMKTLDSSNKVA